ncbi:hypothetical protein IFU01_18355 [Oxalobacteraceae sp. CFBP 8763]|nr:hypothetical protein [Oxalobacteraceae sp. CFBP 8763]
MTYEGCSIDEDQPNQVQPSIAPSLTHELVYLAERHGASTRLRNSLTAAYSEGTLNGITIQAVAYGAPTAIKTLSSLQNFGAKCLSEIRSIAILAITESDSNIDESKLNLITPGAHLEPVILNALETLAYLDQRTKKVIEERLGLREQPPQTLEEVGQVLGLTRERVRQIEAKGFTRLRTMFGQALRTRLKSEEANLLQKLTSNSIIPDAEESERFLELSKEARLLIRVNFKSSKIWLDEIATKTENGWLLASLTLDLYSEAKVFIDQRLKDLKVPCLISNLRSTNSNLSNAIDQVIRLDKRFRIQENYILPSRSTRRARRAVRIHQTILCQGLASPMVLGKLKEMYRKKFPDDQCSARDLCIILNGNPHLFLNQYEIGWIAVGTRQVSNGATLSNEPAVSLSDDVSDETADEDTETLRSILSSILLLHGPQSFNDLRKIFITKVGGRYSKSSVGPILISHDEFLRIGPGIYAHKKHGDDPEVLRSSSKRLLLNRTQCEIFCRSIWAGEQRNAYLLWSPQAEIEWAEWCYETGEEVLMNSLLAVCNIADWPTKAGEKSRWSRLKERFSFYCLEEPPPELVARLPSYREFLASAAYVANVKRISWISANRVNAYRIDDRHSASLVALLIASGVIEPAMHWQHDHLSTNEAEEIVERLIGSNEHQPPSRWPRTMIRYMRTRYSSLGEPGWTTEASVSALLDALHQIEMRDDQYEEPTELANANYEKLRTQLKNELLLDKLRQRTNRTN